MNKIEILYKLALNEIIELKNELFIHKAETIELNDKIKELEELIKENDKLN